MASSISSLPSLLVEADSNCGASMGWNIHSKWLRRDMTAEHATTNITDARRILRHLSAVCQRRSRNTRQSKAATRVAQGARWRSAMARVSADGDWWRKGRMMKKGTKKKAKAARADGTKRNQRK